MVFEKEKKYGKPSKNYYTEYVNTHYILIFISYLPKSMCDLINAQKYYGTTVIFNKQMKLWNKMQEMYLDVRNWLNLIQPYFNKHEFIFHKIRREHMLDLIKTYFNENNKLN